VVAAPLVLPWHKLAIIIIPFYLSMGWWAWCARLYTKNMSVCGM
jgi:hypothetical protein